MIDPLNRARLIRFYGEHLVAFVERYVPRIRVQTLRPGQRFQDASPAAAHEAAENNDSMEFTNGLFAPVESTIYLHPEAGMSTFVHEFAHALDFAIKARERGRSDADPARHTRGDLYFTDDPNDDLAEEFRKLAWDAIQRGDQITNYATTSPSEYFAEAVTALLDVPPGEAACRCGRCPVPTRRALAEKSPEIHRYLTDLLANLTDYRRAA